MKLDQLTYFVEAARRQHLGEAARILRVSPSAISHSIAALEDELGRDLFVKQGKNVVLTGHGRLLLERAEHLLAQAQALRDAIARDQLELRRHFRIAAVHMVSARYLVPAWAALSEKNRELSGELFTLRSAEVVAGVLQHEFDLGICFNPQGNVRMESRVLRRGQLRVAVRRGHPLLKRPARQRLRQLADYPAVLPKSFQGIDPCERHPVFDRFDIEPHVDCLIDSYELALAKVACSTSWSLVPDWLIGLHGSGKEVQALPAPARWEAPYFLAAVWPTASFLDQTLEKLVDGVAAAIGAAAAP